MQKVKWNIPKIFQNIPCTKSHLSWKFCENTFIRFRAMLLTDRQTNRQTDRQTGGQWWKHNFRHAGDNKHHPWMVGATKYGFMDYRLDVTNAFTLLSILHLKCSRTDHNWLSSILLSRPRSKCVSYCNRYAQPIEAEKNRLLIWKMYSN